MGLHWSPADSGAGCARRGPTARTGSGHAGGARGGCAPQARQRISGAGDLRGPAAAAAAPAAPAPAPAPRRDGSGPGDGGPPQRGPPLPAGGGWP